MAREFLYRQNEFLVVLLAIFVFLFITEIGFRRGRSSANGLADASKSQLSTLQGALIGLLGLLLAFSFAMAEARFETRQRLVVDEANAIGDAYRLSGILPEPYHAETMEIFRDYVNARLANYRAEIDPLSHPDAVARVAKDQKDLWSRAITVAGKTPNSSIVALYITALSDLIDSSKKRDAARENHVPEIVLYLLFFVATVSLGLVGFACGVGNRRHLPITVSVSVLIAFVIMVVMDLDHPRRGLIEVNQESMINLEESLR